MRTCGWSLALILAVAVVAGTACDAPEATGDHPGGPSSAAGPAREGRAAAARGATSVRFRCRFPAEDAADGMLPAWWGKTTGATNRSVSATLADGSVTIEVPHGRGAVSFHVPGHVVVEREIRAERGRVVDGGVVDLALATPLRGRVVDASGAPVAGAFVYTEGDDASLPLESTDDDGRFEFVGLPDGLVTLRVESDDFVTARVPCRLREGAQPVVVALDPGGRVTGDVANADGSAVVDARVWIVDAVAPDDRSRMAWPSVDAGSFAVHLAPGRYLVHAQADGRQVSTTVAVQAGGAHAVQLRIPLE